MTQAPIHPRHKDEAAKAAGWVTGWTNEIDDQECASILAHAQTLANLEAARADLAEIARLLPSEPDTAHEVQIGLIAAPYRASDPVAEALKDIFALFEYSDPEILAVWPAALAKFRAFIEGNR